MAITEKATPDVRNRLNDDGVKTQLHWGLDLEGYSNNGYTDGLANDPEEKASSEITPEVVAPFQKQKETKSADKEKPKVVSFAELFRFADRFDIILMILGTICASAHGFAMPGLVLIFGSLVDDFVGAGGAGNSTFDPSMKPWPHEMADPFLKAIQTKCIYYVIVAICVLFVAYGQVMFWLTIAHRQTYKIRNQFLRAILRQEIGWFDRHDSGEIGIRLTDDVNKIQAGIGDKFGGCAQHMATFVAGIIIALVKGWKLALVILSTSPLLVASASIMMFLITASTKKKKVPTATLR